MTSRRSAAEWERLVAAWRRSGRPAREFARAVGVAPATLSWWAWKVGSKGTSAAQASRSQPAQGFSFLPVRVVDATPVPAPEAPIEIDVGRCRVRVRRGFDVTTLRALLDLLEA